MKSDPAIQNPCHKEAYPENFINLEQSKAIKSQMNPSFGNLAQRWSWHFHFDLQLVPTIRNSTFLYYTAKKLVLSAIWLKIANV